jgi:hypothetical protein
MGGDVDLAHIDDLTYGREPLVREEGVRGHVAAS